MFCSAQFAEGKDAFDEPVDGVSLDNQTVVRGVEQMKPFVDTDLGLTTPDRQCVEGIKIIFIETRLQNIIGIIMKIQRAWLKGWL